jgi:hypothetical protein
MMMGALYHGQKGFDLLVAPIMEKTNREFDGYQPNPNGLYEVGLASYMDSAFLRWIPDDCIIKVMYDGLPCLYPNEYKIVFMDRDEDEVRVSEARLERFRVEAAEATGVPWKDHTPHTEYLPFCCLRPYNKEDVDHVLAICGARRDFDVIRVNYGDVIENPEREFNRLLDWGIPIDPEKCASTIDKSLHRVRREECRQQEQECKEPPLQLL